MIKFYHNFAVFPIVNFLLVIQIESKIAPDLVAYCLRHTYGTDLQDAGVPINVAKYLMGHSDIKMTANVYTDTTFLAIKSAGEKINEFVQISMKNRKNNEKT